MYKSKKYKIVKIYEKDYNNVNNKNNYDTLFLLNNEKIKNNQNGGNYKKYNDFINSDYSELCYDYDKNSEK